jgi:hypothetical protein
MKVDVTAPMPGIKTPKRPLAGAMVTLLAFTIETPEVKLRAEEVRRCRV